MPKMQPQRIALERSVRFRTQWVAFQEHEIMQQTSQVDPYADGVVTLGEILDDMRAMPGISSWDDAFCAALQDAIRVHGTRLLLSDTQIMVLTEMRRRLLILGDTRRTTCHSNH